MAELGTEIFNPVLTMSLLTCKQQTGFTDTVPIIREATVKSIILIADKVVMFRDQHLSETDTYVSVQRTYLE